MVDDAALVEQAVPDVLGEEEMRGVVAVQVPDLAGADLERELAAAAVTGLDALPRGDFFGDLLAGCLCACHPCSFIFHAILSTDQWCSSLRPVSRRTWS